jgi:hypothetical protein
MWQDDQKLCQLLSLSKTAQKRFVVDALLIARQKRRG